MRDKGRDGKQKDRERCRVKEARGREEAATLHIFRL